jgi:DnaK suppressor protein
MSHLVMIKKQLLARKQELQNELNRLSEDQMRPEMVQDPIDQATLSNIEELNISIQKNEREEFDMIVKALEMIDAGTYGVCVDCGAKISEKRLSMYPNATRCIACQETFEGAKS